MSRFFGGRLFTTRPPIRTSPSVIWLEPGDHPQRRRLAAPRRTDEDHELAVADRQVELATRPSSRPDRPSSAARARSQLSRASTVRRARKDTPVTLSRHRLRSGRGGNRRSRSHGRRWQDVFEERRFLAPAPDRSRGPLHRPARRRAARPRGLPQPHRRDRRLADRRLRRPPQLHGRSGRARTSAARSGTRSSSRSSRRRSSSSAPASSRTALHPRLPRASGSSASSDPAPVGHAGRAEGRSAFLWIFDSLYSVVNWTLIHDIVPGSPAFYPYKALNWAFARDFWRSGSRSPRSSRSTRRSGSASRTSRWRRSSSCTPGGSCRSRR